MQSSLTLFFLGITFIWLRTNHYLNFILTVCQMSACRNGSHFLRKTTLKNLPAWSVDKFHFRWQFSWQIMHLRFPGHATSSQLTELTMGLVASGVSMGTGPRARLWTRIRNWSQIFAARREDFPPLSPAIPTTQINIQGLRPQCVHSIRWYKYSPQVTLKSTHWKVFGCLGFVWVGNFSAPHSS